MSKKNRTWLIVAIVVIILIVIMTWPEKEVPVTEVPEGFTPETIEELPAAPEIDVEKIKKKQEKVAGEEVVEEVKEAVAVAPGASLVTKEGIVVTEEGEPTQSEALPSAPEAPKQSEVLTEEEKVVAAEDAIELELSRENGFVPNQFKVKPGQAVTIALTAVDDQNHTFRFRVKSLKGVAISVQGGQTRVVTFNAPTNLGSYEFGCSIPSHKDSEVGQMVVTAE